MSSPRGQHALRFGGDVRNDAYHQDGNQFLRGSFSFNSNATQNPTGRAGTGYGFADYLLGLPYQSNASGAIATARFRSVSYTAFIDDNWRVSHLTIEIVLRQATPRRPSSASRTIKNGVPKKIRPRKKAGLEMQD